MKIPRYTMAYTVYETDRNDEAGEWCKWEDVQAALVELTNTIQSECGLDVANEDRRQLGLSIKTWEDDNL